MYTDRAKGRLKTGGAIFAETSAVIPAGAGMTAIEGKSSIHAQLSTAVKVLCAIILGD